MARRIAHQDEIPEDRIRERAHHIWEREGCPDGRHEEHWQMARSELAIELGAGLATMPAPTTEQNPHPEPVEPLEAVENQGSFPGTTDQDEEQQYPKRLKKARGKRGGVEDRA